MAKRPPPARSFPASEKQVHKYLREALRPGGDVGRAGASAEMVLARLLAVEVSGVRQAHVDAFRATLAAVRER